MAEIWIAPTRQGTLNVTAGTSAAVGIGTNFITADAGRQITIRTTSGDKQYVINTVLDSTHILLNAVSDVTQDGCYFTINLYQLDAAKGFDYSLNYNIADIREPDKRNSNYSKTITIPGSKANNKIFGSIFEINLDGTFNPNLRADAIIYQETLQVFRGNLQLLKVNKRKGSISYDVAILGAAGDLFARLLASMPDGSNQIDKMLTDIDLLEYNHILNITNQAISWSAAVGVGYVYPLVNNGLTDFNQVTPNFKVRDIRPALYVKTLVDKIFKSVGFKYTSSFFNTDYFKRLIIPCSKTATRSVTVKVNYDINNTDASAHLVTIRVRCRRALDGREDVLDRLIYNIQGGNVVIDTDSVVVDGIYQGDIIYITIDTDAPSEVRLEADTNSFEVIYAPLIGQPDGSFKATLTTNVFVSDDPTDATVVYDDDSTGSNYNLLGSYDNATGFETVSPFNIAGCLTDNITQRDFFVWIIKMFNLYIQPDPDNYYNLIIEPRDSFYTGNTRDWTNKVDNSKPNVLIPMGELDWKFYHLGYKSDTDFYNKFYQDNYNQVYGDKLVAVNNDFVTATKKIEVGFSPTPSAGNWLNNLVLPSMLQGNVTGVQPEFKGNIRILYYGGLKAGNWNHVDDNNVQARTLYPFSGHTDDPQTATIDLLFEQPRLLFWRYNAPDNYPTDNLYNLYYRNFLAEVSDKDAKIVQWYMHLTSLDLYLLDFRDTFFIKDSYFRLNKISAFNPENGESALCEFIKINDAVTLPEFLQTQPQSVVLTDSQLINISGLENALKGVKQSYINGYPVSTAVPADGATLIFSTAQQSLNWSAVEVPSEFLTPAFSTGFD